MDGLESDVSILREQINETAIESMNIQFENTALREQLAQLADFASHADDCEWWGSIPRTTCSCGLADILDQVEKKQ